MFYGYGILRGMWVTLKQFFASYYKKPGQDGALFTVEYPEQRLPEKERFRNFPFLVYDKEPENLRCVACDICAKECPPKCIYIVREFDKDGKPLKRPAIFDIDFTVCMNCGICEEACPFDAIFMDHEFEIAAAERNKDLLYDRDDLLKSNEYFHRIRPTDATAIDARLKEADDKKKAAEAAAKAKAEAAKNAPPPPPPASQQPPQPPKPAV
jgi:NADH-quinone oxidoreductase subunit I